MEGNDGGNGEEEQQQQHMLKSYTSSNMDRQVYQREFQELVDRGYEGMKSFEWDKPMVMLAGNSGSGKSTLLNVILGNELICEEDLIGKTFLKLKNEEHAKFAPGIGNNAFQSHTLYPEMYDPKKIEEAKMAMKRGKTKEEDVEEEEEEQENSKVHQDWKDIGFADTAGFEDTRGIHYQGIAAMFTQYMLHKANNLRGIIILINFNSLRDGKSDSFRKILKAADALFPRWETKDYNIAFGFTQAPKKTTSDKIIQWIEEETGGMKTKNSESEILRKGVKMLKKFKHFLFPAGKEGQIIPCPDLSFVHDWGVMDKSDFGYAAPKTVLKTLASNLFNQMEKLTNHIREVEVAAEKLSEAVETKVNLEREVRVTKKSLVKANSKTSQSLRQAADLLEDVIQAKTKVLNKVINAREDVAERLQECLGSELAKLNDPRFELYWHDEVTKSGPNLFSSPPTHSFLLNAEIPLAKIDLFVDESKVNLTQNIESNDGWLEIRMTSKKGLTRYKDLKASIDVYVSFRDLPSNVEKRKAVQADIKRLRTRHQELEEKQRSSAKEIRDLEGSRISMLKTQRTCNFQEGVFKDLAARIEKKQDEAKNIKLEVFSKELKDAVQALNGDPKLLFLIEMLKCLGESKERIHEIEKSKRLAEKKAKPLLNAPEALLKASRLEYGDPDAINPTLDGETAFRILQSEKNQDGISLMEFCRGLCNMSPDMRPQEAVDLFNHLKDSSGRIRCDSFFKLWDVYVAEYEASGTYASAEAVRTFPRRQK